jgi:gamma-glutamylcyclotransferase (GGCT)/AIG2-like uncharacterized protein YtfP
MRGEIEHPALEGAAFVKDTVTEDGYRLVEVNARAALIRAMHGGVDGELYELGPEVLRQLDILREAGRLYSRETVTLHDGQRAFAYLMSEDQVRGKRRVPGSSWRQRFAPPGLGRTVR